LSDKVWTVNYVKSGKIVRGSHGKKYYSTEGGAKRRAGNSVHYEVRTHYVVSEAYVEEKEEAEVWMNYLEAAGYDNCEAYSYAQELRSEEEGDEE
jgi:hypothetical protein